MVVYEVTAKVELERCDEYEEFMRGLHIPALMATGSFTNAWFERSESGRYRILCIADAQSSLDTYLSEHAPGLRKDFYDHFPDSVELSREVWDVLEQFA